MAIVKMKKLKLMVASPQREQLLRELMLLGCVEISEPSAALQEYSFLTQAESADLIRLRSEHDRILKEAAAERDRLIAAAQEQARDEAGKIMEETRERIRQEKEAALRDIRREVAVLSVSIAEKVVRKELSTDAGQQELVDRIFDELS